MIKLQAPSQIINGDETVSVTRTGRVIYVDGKPKEMDKVTFQVIGNVQPLGGRDLLLVPEGDRHREQYFIWSENKTRAMEVNDMVERCGKKYQVQSVEDWGSYRKTRIMLIDVGPDRQP